MPDIAARWTCSACPRATRTFAFVAYGEDGLPADCVVWGQDPAAMIDGTLWRVNEPPFDLAGCRVLP